MVLAAILVVCVQGKQELVARGGGSAETERAVAAGLAWLAKHQKEDGSWSAKGYLDRCERRCEPHGVDESTEDHPVGLTAVALLAFLGAGHTHGSSSEYGDVVRNALVYLIGRQDQIGRIDDGSILDHAAATLALAEAYGMTGSTELAGPAQSAVDALMGLGAGGDVLETGWTICALKAADLAGLSFDRMAAYDAARERLDAADTEQGIPAAVALLCRIYMDKRRGDERAQSAARALRGSPPVFSIGHVDFAYWHWGSMAMFQYDGPEGPNWKDWNRTMVDALVNNQNLASDVERYGSWEPDGRDCGVAGGRVYATAVNVLTLETYYRYASVFGGRDEGFGRWSRRW